MGEGADGRGKAEEEESRGLVEADVPEMQVVPGCLTHRPIVSARSPRSQVGRLTLHTSERDVNIART